MPGSRHRESPAAPSAPASQGAPASRARPLHAGKVPARVWKVGQEITPRVFKIDICAEKPPAARSSPPAAPAWHCCTELANEDVDFSYGFGLGFFSFFLNFFFGAFLCIPLRVTSSLGGKTVLLPTHCPPASSRTPRKRDGGMMSSSRLSVQPSTRLPEPSRRPSSLTGRGGSSGGSRERERSGAGSRPRRAALRR